MKKVVTAVVVISTLSAFASSASAALPEKVEFLALRVTGGNEFSSTLRVLAPALEPSVSADPVELQKCLAACKAGGSTIIRYCGTMPTPQLRAMCYAAAAAGTVSCMGFCYARFVD